MIAATSRDLGQLVRDGNFREDLFYRLNVLPIRVPPLRERRADIPALVEVLGDDMAMRSGGQPPELSPEAFALLSAQSWRGNIRELRNVLEQAMMRSDSHQLVPVHLEAVLRESGVAKWVPVLPDTAVTTSPALTAPNAADLVRPLSEQVAELEGRAIAAALQAAKGNKVLAAKMLGISRATLYARLG